MRSRSSLPVSTRRHWPVKEALLLVYLALHAPLVIERVESLGLSASLLAYGGLFALLGGALWVAGRIGGNALRWPVAMLLFASAAYMASNEAITGQHFDYETWLNMLGAAGFAGDAFAQHGARIAGATLAALPLLFAIGIAPRRRSALGWKAGLGIPVAVLALFSALLFVRGGDGARALPSAWPPLAYGVLYSVEALTSPPTAPAEVTMRPGTPRAAGDVVLVIDESIAPVYLDIVDPAGVRSGLAEAATRGLAHSFGIAAAVTHCSLGSNLTLRHGGTRTDYRWRNEAGPTIWQYARAAGYRTVYLDGQRTGGAYQNAMDDAERAAIDRFVQLDDIALEDRDHALAERLAEHLADGVRDLIVVNKVGAHFPVQAKYPEAATRYGPVPDRGGFAGVVDTASRDGFEDSAESWRRYRNAYRNTIEWNVGGFFDRLFAAGIGNATILYTADHGQDLNERGRAGASTHCSGDPSAAEGAVPLVVIAAPGARGPDWTAAARANRDRASHFQLFPTMLALMGYPGADVMATYGPGLDGELRDEMRFNTRYNARLGREPEWLAVRPADLPRPPADDVETGQDRP